MFQYSSKVHLPKKLFGVEFFPTKKNPPKHPIHPFIAGVIILPTPNITREIPQNCHVDVWFLLIPPKMGISFNDPSIVTLQQLSFLCAGTGAERDTTSPQWAAMQLHGCGEEQNNGRNKRQIRMKRNDGCVWYMKTWKQQLVPYRNQKFNIFLYLLSSGFKTMSFPWGKILWKKILETSALLSTWWVKDCFYIFGFSCVQFKKSQLDSQLVSVFLGSLTDAEQKWAEPVLETNKVK